MSTIKVVSATETISREAPDKPDRTQRLVILVICSMSLLIVGLDSTIVNVALPSIHKSFPSSLAGLQWTIDAYTLVIASLLMLSGSTADRIGRKRVFLAGLAIFSIGSALCAAAPSLNALIAARILQAIGGSMLNPVAMSIIRNVFEDPRERAQAVGVWGAMIGISMALGPILGGALVDSVGWRAVFIVNVPVGALAMTLTTLFVPESRAEHARKIDPIGQLLVIVALAALTYAIIEGPDHGWGSAEILGLFAVSILAFAVLIPYELRRREPLVQLRFFRSAPFAGASVIAICAFAAFGGFLFLNTLYLQDARGLSPLHAGLYLVPMAAMMLVFAPISGRLVGSYGSRPSLVSSGIFLIIAAVMLTRLQPHSAPVYVLGSYAVFGIGFGLVNAPITNTAISGMPPAQAGVAAAIASTSRQVGVTLGVALVGAVLGGDAAEGGRLGPGFASASHPAWWIIVGVVCAVLVLGALTTTKWAEATARRTAARLSEHQPAAPAVAGATGS
jgi:EmrB/QacA subfamily drug resistance transporter